MFTYGFTIKCNWRGYDNNVQALVSFIIDLFKDHELLVTNFEEDSKGRLHAHGAIRTVGKIRYTDFKVKGWAIYLRRVYELSGWYQYIQKDVTEHRERLEEMEEEYYKHNYGFAVDAAV